MGWRHGCRIMAIPQSLAHQIEMLYFIGVEPHELTGDSVGDKGVIADDDQPRVFGGPVTGAVTCR